MDEDEYTVDFRRYIGQWLGDLGSVYADHLADERDATDLDTLAALSAMSKVIDEQIGRIARNTDATWQQIGDVLGTSRQAAHKRFSKP